MTHTSVIIPAYCAAGTVRRAVDSVLRQTMHVLEVIVVDDGSPDGIAAALIGTDPRVRVIRQPNGGAGSARNTGIDAASGDWIAFLDADDEWLPSRLASQFEAIERYPDVGLIMGRFEVRPAGLPSGTTSGWSNIPTATPLELRGDRALRFAAACWTGTVLVRRDVVGEERFRTDLRTAEDREFWYRISIRTRVLALDEVLAVQHVTSGSLSTTDIDDDCANMLKVVGLHGDDLTPSERRAWRLELLRRRAAVHLAAGRFPAAHAAASDRLRLAPWSLEAWYIWLKSLYGGSR
ncbi:MAG TPA: glycosyltransferase family 2 protein [Gemmatimonadales bacterium]|nr:glycosyltransferase family 2 protein [Gemmatimonadales bacterium]